MTWSLLTKLINIMEDLKLELISNLIDEITNEVISTLHYENKDKIKTLLTFLRDSSDYIKNYDLEA